MTPLILGPFCPIREAIKRHQDNGDAHHPRPLRGYDVPSASIVKTKQRSFEVRPLAVLQCFLTLVLVVRAPHRSQLNRSSQQHLVARAHEVSTSSLW